MTSLRFAHPADAWTSAMPIGDGRLGAMLFGGTGDELLDLNEVGLWSGSAEAAQESNELTNKMARRRMAEARDAIASGNPAAASAPLQALQEGHSQAFLPLGTLRILGCGQADVPGYERSLDIRTGIHVSRWGAVNHTVRRTTAIEPAMHALVHLIESDDLLQDIRIELDSPWKHSQTETTHGQYLHLRVPSDVVPPHDSVENHLRFSSASRHSLVLMTVRHDGENRGERIIGARRIEIRLVAETGFAGIGHAGIDDPEQLAKSAAARLDELEPHSAEELVARSAAETSRRLGDASILTGADPGGTTDTRLLRANRDGQPARSDPALVGLLWEFGRYLLQASCRPGGAPPNLQGIWNADPVPPWSSNYTTNINLPMNFWGAEPSGLAPCLEPLWDLIELVASTGAPTARRLYGAPGWVVHHNTDIWGYSRIAGDGNHNPKWSFWPFGGAWLLHAVGERLAYGFPTQERATDFAERMWGPASGAALFLLNWLQWSSDGTLGTSPSTSPENEFLGADGIAAVGRSSTMDIALIDATFALVVDLAARTGREHESLVTAISLARTLLPKPTITPDGLVAEWQANPPEVDPHHRHLSNLWAVHPGVLPLDPAFAEAASRSLDRRGDESTGWSMVWKIALRARLKDGEGVDRLLQLALRDMAEDRGSESGGLYPNLFSAHPPFQIDANLGFVGALAECLVQSHTDAIELLPALPRSIPEGSARAIAIRGGRTVDLVWENGGLVSATIRARWPWARGSVRVRWAGRTIGREILGIGLDLYAEDFL